MKKSLYILLMLGMFTFLQCEKEYLSPVETSVDMEMALRIYNVKALKATGDVEVEFINNLGKLKRAYVTFEAIGPNGYKAARGEFAIRMVNHQDILKREIVMNVDDVFVDPDTKEAWFSGIVLWDERYQDHGDGGGCNHDDEGGCSHDDEGGCDHDDTGGCDHGEGDDDHGGGGPMNREGQTLNVYVFDGGTPGVNGDYIGWKWGGQGGHDEPHDPHLAGLSEHGPIYCEKPIIGGNLNVFSR